MGLAIVSYGVADVRRSAAAPQRSPPLSCNKTSTRPCYSRASAAASRELNP